MVQDVEVVDPPQAEEVLPPADEPDPQVEEPPPGTIEVHAAPLPDPPTVTMAY